MTSRSSISVILHRASHSDPNDFVNLVVSTIKERGWGGGRIGYEAGHEMLMGLPIADWEHLRGQLDTPFVPAGEPIWRVRMIKSPLEVERLRRASVVTNTAHEVLRDSLRKRRVEDAARRRLGLPPVVALDGDIDAVDERLSLSETARQAVSSLPARDRELLRLRVIEERPYREIAARLR